MIGYAESCDVPTAIELSARQRNQIASPAYHRGEKKAEVAALSNYRLHRRTIHEEREICCWLGTGSRRCRVRCRSPGRGFDQGKNAASRSGSGDSSELGQECPFERAFTDAVSGDARVGDRTALPQRILEQPSRRYLCRRGFGRAAVPIQGQVRVGNGLAQLHASTRTRQ